MLFRSAPALFLALAAPLALSPGDAGAASINHGTFNGTTIAFQNVTESSITDGLPLFGAPTVAGDGLAFTPSAGFQSSAAGGADTTSATLSITLQAAPGQFLQNIVIAESGSFAFATDALTAGTGQVSISGLLTVTDLSNGTGVRTAVLLVNASGALSYPGVPNAVDGTWTASASIDLSGLGITRARVQLNNNLQSLSSNAAVSATVRKDLVTITNTPEPGTAALLAAGLAGLGLAGRRRPGRA